MNIFNMGQFSNLLLPDSSTNWAQALAVAITAPVAVETALDATDNASKRFEPRAALTRDATTN